MDIGGTSFAQFDEPISVYEGTVLQRVYRVDTSQDQRFIIDNSSADTNTIRVKVYASGASTVYDTYEQANNILEIGSTDKVFFVNEIEDEGYELFFGDGVIGRKLEDGEIVDIS